MFTIPSIIRPRTPESPEKPKASWFHDLRDRIGFLMDPFCMPIHIRSAFSDSMREVGFGRKVDAEINAQKSRETRARIQRLEEGGLAGKVVNLDDYRSRKH